MKKKTFSLAIHGGAGTMDRATMTPEKEKEYRAALENALKAGAEILQRGGASLDTVEAVVRLLEDDPHFNAGRGAVFTSAGRHELDASIMDGRNMKAGAVASVQHIRNPIGLARLVMEKSPHVMLVGEGAEMFAREQGLEMVEQKYFSTPERWDELQRKKEEARGGGGASPQKLEVHGTVGAVALDQNGNLAAATSTGGTVNKRPGRIGDSPIIGAGTYAKNGVCAVSATGDGEYFIRAAVAHQITALVEQRGMKVEEAAQAALDEVARLGGKGGVIVLDAKGRSALLFNTSGMYRGLTDQDGKYSVEIYK